MNIAIVDPFFEKSHAHWANGIKAFSKYNVDIYSNPPVHWKWQMIGGTLEIAERIKPTVGSYDLLLVTDMLDLPCFLGLLSKEKLPPTVLYFHENQITYPWSPSDSDIREKRDYHYGFINVRSAITADYVLFNSEYHKASFLNALPPFLNKFPKINWPISLDILFENSLVIPIGINQKIICKNKKTNELPIFIWNHRWEYDKGPEFFFNTLISIKNKDYNFGLIVVGKPYSNQPPIFAKAKEELKAQIIHWGYVANKNEYYQKLSESNILMITGQQDFFGISVIEAIQYGNLPILPNRLAYPEHLPKGTRDEALYNDDKLIDKIFQVIDSKKYLDTQKYENHIEKYLWKRVIKEYDDFFIKVVAGRRH
ncbi:MAG: DUF3524 domain-containing protein [Saprospiraceae bacterium]